MTIRDIQINIESTEQLLDYYTSDHDLFIRSFGRCNDLIKTLTYLQAELNTITFSTYLQDDTGRTLAEALILQRYYKHLLSTILTTKFDSEAVEAATQDYDDLTMSIEKVLSNETGQIDEQETTENDGSSLLESNDSSLGNPKDSPY